MKCVSKSFKLAQFIVACLIAAALAAPSVDPATAALRALPALTHEEIHDQLGQYTLRYVTAEGIIVTETGKLVPTPDGKAYVLVVEGETSYIGDDGKTYITKYSAGLNGTHMEGAHLPVPVVAEVVAAPIV